MAATISDRTKAIIAFAAQEAGRGGHAHVRPDHVLYAILHEGGGVACLALDRLRVDRSALLEVSRLRLQAGSQVADRDAATVSATLAPDLLSAAAAEANSLGHWYVGSEHLLLALTRPEAENLADLLASHGVAYHAAKAMVAELLGQQLEPS